MRSEVGRNVPPLLTLHEIENNEDESDSEDVVSSERMRLVEGSEDLILVAEIEFKRLYQHVNANISIRVTFIRGQKEAPQQILQYIKNKLV